MGDFQGHPFRGNQWHGTRVGEANAPGLSQGDYAPVWTDGSAPTPDDNPTGVFSTSAKAALASQERRTREQDFESAVVWNEDGSKTLIDPRDGGASYVDFSRMEVLRMARGVLTHNHPKSGPLSAEDVALTITGGLREMRAQCKNGTLYRLGSERGWTDGMLATFRNLHGDSMARTRSRIAQGKLTYDAANAGYAEEMHQILTQFAKDYTHMGVYYKRSKAKH